MDKRVEELMEWAAGEISKEAHHGEIIKGVFPSEWERDLKRAKQILSHPDLALIDRDKIRLDEEAIPLISSAYKHSRTYPIIPLADALKELE